MQIINLTTLTENYTPNAVRAVKRESDEGLVAETVALALRDGIVEASDGDILLVTSDTSAWKVKVRQLPAVAPFTVQYDDTEPVLV